MYSGDETRTLSGPDAADWLVGLVHSFHPLRWLLGLVGLGLTGFSLVAARACLNPGPLDFAGWWQQPTENADALCADILGGSVGRAVVRGGPLLAFNTMLWCLIGGWIARHHLMARRPERYDSPEKIKELSATAFLCGWWRSLLACCPLLLFLVLLFLAPVLIAGYVNAWFGGAGAVVVALLLPIVLLAGLLLLVFVLGALAWPLMPVAVAAECGDVFDALSRSVNYLFQSPIRFLLLTAIAVALAGLPLGFLFLFAESLAAWPQDARRVAVALGAGLAASQFWTLQTLVYLHLRRAIDEVGAEVIADERSREAHQPTPENKTVESPVPGATRPVGGAIRLRATILTLGAVVASWCLTYWLFTRVSSGPTAWLGWGLSEDLIPPAEGAYKVASVIAGVWVAIWLVWPLLLWIVNRRRAALAVQDAETREPS